MMDGARPVPAWRVVARWLLVLPLSALALCVAFFLIMMLPEGGLIGSLDRSRFNLPIGELLGLQTFLQVFILCALWQIVTALAVGFAARWRKLSSLAIGLFASLVLTGVYVWMSATVSSEKIPRIAAIVAGFFLLFGAAVSNRRPCSPKPQLLAELLAFVVLLAPSMLSIANAPRSLPSPQKLWTVTLQERTWHAMNTGSTFAATRHLAFAGDRLVAIYEAASAPYQGKQPMSEYAMKSLDALTGTMRNEKRFIGSWGATPALYTTSDGDLILADSNLTKLHSDLTTAGPHFDPSKGLVEQMSPDGSTLAWENLPGVTLVNATTLMPINNHLDASAPTTVSSSAVLTNNMSWFGAYPKDTSFVTLTGTTGQHLLWHGKCGGRPEFLTENLIFQTGCGTIDILDLQGTVVREAKMAGNVRFTGVSQNGKRFAVVVSEWRGDFPVTLYEHFILFDTATLRALAMVRTEHMPEIESWSAFSPDGKLFASGDASALSLYKVP